METPIESLRSNIGAGFGTPEKIIENLKDYLNRGIGLITFRFDNMEDIQIFSKEVLPHF